MATLDPSGNMLARSVAPVITARKGCASTARNASGAREDSADSRRCRCDADSALTTVVEVRRLDRSSEFPCRPPFPRAAKEINNATTATTTTTIQTRVRTGNAYTSDALDVLDDGEDAINLSHLRPAAVPILSPDRSPPDLPAELAPGDWSESGAAGVDLFQYCRPACRQRKGWACSAINAARPMVEKPSSVAPAVVLSRLRRHPRRSTRVNLGPVQLMCPLGGRRPCASRFFSR
jgi:hypothetical protein